MAGRKVLIAYDTHSRGAPYLGATVHVWASNTDRVLVAVELTVKPNDRPADLIRFSGELSEFGNFSEFCEFGELGSLSELGELRELG